MKRAAFLIAWLSFAALPAAAASVDVTVRDANGAPLEDAVVWAVPRSPLAPRPKREAAIEQIERAFVPLVTVVQTGTRVKFPNRDPIRHHVYSFSPAKVFEIKLYVGTPAEPVLFDKPGEVVLGCNIHDHMLAYLYVVDSPHFAKAGKDGRARIGSLPAGDFELHAWHYAQASRPDARLARLRAEDAAVEAFVVPLRPLPPRREAK